MRQSADIRWMAGRNGFLFLLLMTSVQMLAQDMLSQYAERLKAFGRTIPQEKVFIHMDNTSYQIGDTIWFSAYTRRTDTGKPSDVSGVLYVELFGQEGYMIERKLIQMKDGHGSGFFSLNNLIQYAGFYELRAYTRWQLNWGCFEHEHPITISQDFASKRQEKEYYRDYEKLYSRVFPVYDKPIEPGEFNHDMTLRATRRKYDDTPQKQELQVTLYPEGGNMVEGLPCRVAFEATWNDGTWADGYLKYGNDSVATVHRGRGCFVTIPQRGQKDVLFVAKDGQTAKARLPKPEQTGIALCMKQTDAGWTAQIDKSANLPADSLGISLMHEGRLMLFSPYKDNLEVTDISEPGVYQLTVFDTQGHIFADRLFFCRGKAETGPTLSIEGIKEVCQPLEPVRLSIKALDTTTRGGFSLTVRDDIVRDHLYDDANIMTEMLLSSEIRGFVPQPGWYFEKDDDVHRTALDLLMMTQGWRRFDWRDMALQGMWDITQPAEKAPILLGETSRNVTSLPDYMDMEDIKAATDNDNALNEDNSPSTNNKKDNSPSTNDTKGNARDIEDYKKAIDNADRKKQTELKVHSEIITLDAETNFVGEVATSQRAFRIQLPPYYGSAVIFISVADTTKWKEGEQYTWIQAEPDDIDTEYMYLPASRKVRRKIYVEPADYLARIVWPYPRFVRPYSYYQDHLAPLPQLNQAEWVKQDSTTYMSEVTIRSRRHGLQKFSDAWPIFTIDAQEADNMSSDYGLSFMQLMMADYGIAMRKDIAEGEPPYEMRLGWGFTQRAIADRHVPEDSIYAQKYLISRPFSMIWELSPGERKEYQGNGVWDTYALYSDYSPRMEGSKLYLGGNEPKTKLVAYPFPDGSRRMTYRDRHYVLPGFAYPAQFYSPDYSRHPLPNGQQDYRRTLYWNPDLQLDENGEARVTFYNNSRTTSLSVEAEGQTADGTLLWNR